MLRKYILAAAFLLPFPPALSAQDAIADSLRQAYLAQAKDPAKRVDTYYFIAERAIRSKPETGSALGDTLEGLAKAAKDQKNLCRASWIRGQALRNLGKYAEALPHHRRELAIAQGAGDKELHSDALSSVGACLQNLARLDSALIYFTESAKIKEQLDNKADLAATYSNIGNVFSDMRLEDKAIEYLEKALAIRLAMPNGERSAIVTYNNLSVAYGGKEDYDKAIEYAQKGYELATQVGNKFFAGVISGGLGHLWLKKGQPDKAIDLNERSIALLTETQRRSNLVFPYAHLSEAWHRKGNNAKALAVNKTGYAIMEELQLMEPLEIYYENFVNAYEGLGEHQQALFWFRKWMVFDDSLFSKEKLEAVAAVEAKFETEKKEAQLAQQRLELEREAAQKKTILIGAVAALLALLGGFQFFRNKQKIKQKEAELATEKAALAAQLEHAEAEKLREMDAMKTAFFANVSHEFRTPLTLIISPLRQLLDKPDKRPSPSLYRTMLLSGERLLELVNQLLDLTKAEAGKLGLQANEGDLLPLLRGVAGSFSSLADVRQIRFETAMPEGELLARFDGDKLSKIVANLLSNAFKFTPEEGTVRLEVGTYEQGGQHGLSLCVRDTGTGIEAAELPFLFERFYRAKQARREEVAGSGIGLALTKELVQLHGGSIEVASELGQGSTFTVRLPILTGAPTALAIREEVISGASFMGERGERGERGLQVPPGSAQVLIVEDNPDVRLFIKSCLSPEYHILLAPDGKQGLEAARKSIPDLIISDVMMPMMDGFELCQELKSDDRTSHIPVVLLTARAEQSDKMEGLITGADDYLVKPFDALELQTRVANLISQRQKLQAHYRRSLTFGASTPVEAESMDSVFLRRVKEAVEANLEDENFSVVELGLQVGMSRSQLHRKLSALTGFSPNEVIRNMRLERAKELLLKRAGNASEVAYMTGFNSPAYFAKCFKDYFGVTPSEV